jgi:hypothetical protein
MAVPRQAQACESAAKQGMENSKGSSVSLGREGALRNCAALVHGFPRDRLAPGTAVPGFVAALQTFGSFANWHPHVHGIVSEGLFERDGTFLTLWQLDPEAVEERFRQRVISELRKARRLSEDFADTLLGWEHSGFSVQAGRQAAPGETSRIEEMGRYLARPPMPQDLPELLPDGQVLVPTPPDPRTGATEVVLDPLDLLHRIVIQIPDPGQHMVRYCGAYSCRGRRAHARMDETANEGGSTDPESPARGQGGTTDGDPDPEVEVSAYVRARRRSWARLIRRVFGVLSASAQRASFCPAFRTER